MSEKYSIGSIEFAPAKYSVAPTDKNTTIITRDLHPTQYARQLVDVEIAKQDAMWGDGNERADAANGQMLAAATAQSAAVLSANYLADLYPDDNPDRRRAFAFLSAEREFYPPGWSGFRDYGSDIANLVVAAAYLHNEIKRRLRKGESTYRAPRRADQPYNPATGLPKGEVAPSSPDAV
jgi:hypothetical protein